MRGRFIAGITAGTIIGVTAGVMMSPNVDRNTKRKLRKSGRYMMEMAEDAYNGMRHMMR
jgi:gas vesicle protein